MIRALALVALVAALALLFLAPQWAFGGGEPQPEPEPPRIVVVTVERKIEGKPIAWWRARAVRNRKTINRLKRVLLHRPSSVEALRLAAVTYGVPYRTLYWKASCESTGGDGLYAKAKNPTSTASGLGQFLDSTWESTPYAGFSPFSPYANALAMGWMHSPDVGRGGEWAASAHCWRGRVG